MAALQTRRGRGELVSQVHEFVRGNASKKGWTEPKQTYASLIEELGLRKNRVYQPKIAQAIADALLASTKESSNGAAQHNGQAKAEETPTEAALTMAQRMLDRQERYIGMLEAIIEARQPEVAKVLPVLREAIQ